MSYWRVALVTVAALAATTIVLPIVVGGAPASVLPAREASFSGSLLYLNQTGIWRMDLETLQRQPFRWFGPAW